MAQSSVNILIVGAEGSGKSLLVKRLIYLSSQGMDATFEDIPPTISTVGTNINTLPFNGREYMFREVGGAMAPIWKNYYKDIDAVIYMIDRSNQFQVSASVILLLELLSDDIIQNKKVLILFNKKDFPSHFSFDILKKIYRLPEILQSNTRKISILESSCIDKQGFNGIISWMEDVA